MFSDSNYSLDSYTHNYPLSLLSLRVEDSVSSPSDVTQEERNRYILCVCVTGTRTTPAAGDKLPDKIP